MSGQSPGLGRPRPRPSALTEEFWASARRRVLVRPVCRACHRSFFTPQIACPTCLSEVWAYEPSSGRGTVYSASVVHRAPFPGLETPYQVGIVDLEEEWSMLTNITDPRLGATPIGTAVEVTWVEISEELVLPAFRPTAVESPVAS